MLKKMDRKHVFFRVSENRPITHKEYIYVANYKFTHPDEDVTMCVYAPDTTGGHYGYLCAFSGIDILGLDSVGIIAENILPIDEFKITDENILTFPFYHIMEFLSRGITEEMKILDLGCGDKSLSKQFIKGNVTTLDCYDKLSPDILHDLTKPLPFTNNSYDVAILLDVIEHLEKLEGFKLLNEIKRVVKKRFFVLTPLLWKANEEETNDPNSPYYHNDYNLHHSLWSPSDFREFTRVENPIMVDYFFGYWEKK